MFIDSYKTLVMEHCSHPGNIGDSCAETSRYAHLKLILNNFLPDADDVDLNAFITTTGILRHPTAPYEDDHGESWREDDIPTDQALPLFLSSPGTISKYVTELIKNAGYRTGNGDLVSPIFFGFLTGRMWIVNVSTFVQGLLFKMPWRWSDQYNRFEEMKDSSADYLNYIHAGVYASVFSRKIVLKSTLKKKVRDYYAKEPNCNFLIDLYDKVIDKYW